MRPVLVLILIAACGSNDVHHVDDAPASSDSPLGDAPGGPAPVTVAIMFDGVGVAGVSAIFTNADGSPVATLTTDATGTASQALASGGYVTVVDPFSQGAAPSNLYTWASVKPGDHLELGDSDGSGAETDF